MKKTYITNIPNKIGALLQATKLFTELGINITRVSYNKAVDSHALFIEVQGDEDKLLLADQQLSDIGYINNSDSELGIVLLEFTLRDVTGSATKVLSLIEEYGLNISYISSQEITEEYQSLKVGVRVDDENAFDEFIKKANEICAFRVIEYNKSEKIYDNSFFYKAFVQSLMDAAGTDEDKRELLLINTNLAMEVLEARGLSPYRTFDCIAKFANLLAGCKGEAFSPRVTTHKISENTEITTIEPPCGSNTIVIKSNGQYLFVDSGYACYKEEMLPVLRNVVPEFDSIKKTILVTHADVDHCGLLPLFDEIIASRKTALCLKNEYLGKDGYREMNPLHKPYINICKILTSYAPTDPQKIIPHWNDCNTLTEPLTQIGFFNFGELHFEVYEGKGGHLPGEIVLIDYAMHIAITGDVYINVHGLTPEQAEYNQYAPILMTSVDTDPTLCAQERKAIIGRLGVGKWQIFGAHGFKKDYSVSS